MAVDTEEVAASGHKKKKRKSETVQPSSTAITNGDAEEDVDEAERKRRKRERKERKAAEAAATSTDAITEEVCCWVDRFAIPFADRTLAKQPPKKKKKKEVTGS